MCVCVSCLVPEGGSTGPGQAGTAANPPVSSNRGMLQDFAHSVHMRLARPKPDLACALLVCSGRRRRRHACSATAGLLRVGASGGGQEWVHWLHGDALRLQSADCKRNALHCSAPAALQQRLLKWDCDHPLDAGSRFLIGAAAANSFRSVLLGAVEMRVVLAGSAKASSH